jgi:hypothetical protein
MGFLDHSTNNIIVDAVLTDTGRKTLAKNDGSFVVSKFAMGDDEVDYTIIQKFGVTVGKEKISKNTPVFEAQTNGDLALKNRLLSISTPDLVVLPVLAIGLPSTNNNFNRAATTTAAVDITQKMMGTATAQVPTDLVDTAFVVQYDNRFLSVVRSDNKGTSTKSVANNIATITVAASQASAPWGGGYVQLSLNVVSFSDDYYNTYATDRSASNPVIKTLVQISGRSSGSRVVQEFFIYKV